MSWGDLSKRSIEFYEKFQGYIVGETNWSFQEVLKILPLESNWSTINFPQESDCKS